MAGKLKKFIKEWVLPPKLAEMACGVISPDSKGQRPQQVREIQKTAPRHTPEELALLEKNEELRDRERGKRCFILGGGSSVKNQDLSKLAGECVISMSNTFVHPEFPAFRPKYHVIPAILLLHKRYRSKEYFAPWLKEMDERILDAEIFCHIGDRNFFREFGLFTNRTVHWVEYAPTIWDESPISELDLSRIETFRSSSELAITLALFLGFEKIYLLGIDHDWFNGRLVYFYDHKKEHILKPDESSRPDIDSERCMRSHAKIFRKYKCLYALRENIYNANSNPNTYVDTFPKVDYDSLFDNDDDVKK